MLIGRALFRILEFLVLILKYEHSPDARKLLGVDRFGINLPHHSRNSDFVGFTHSSYLSEYESLKGIELGRC